MEKVIQEFRVIETEDGYRIEIKGDKEKIKSFMGGFGGRKHWRRRWRRRWHGPFAWMRGMHFGGPWDYEPEDEEDEEKED
jgi:hypothetical protein